MSAAACVPTRNTDTTKRARGWLRHELHAQTVRFDGQAALSTVQALARAHAGHTDVVHPLAVRLGNCVVEPWSMDDVFHACELFGLNVRMVQLRPQDLQGQRLPLLLICPSEVGRSRLMLLTHCDQRHTVTHEHGSGAPLSKMGPMHVMATCWAPSGWGWSLVVFDL